jgi:ribosomal-protein-alanine acetyltransferase
VEETEMSATRTGTRTWVRQLNEGDVDSVLAIAAACPEAAQWPRADYGRAVRGEYGAWVAVGGDGRLLGFIVTRCMAKELEILNLAVAPAERRRGLARSLLEAAVAAARESGTRRAFLEVRESNAAAIAFYRRQGFAETGRRPRYYASPAEDALVFAWELS